MTAEEESRETKQEPHEGRHGTRFSAPIVMKVKQLRMGGLLANHKMASNEGGRSAMPENRKPSSAIQPFLEQSA